MKIIKNNPSLVALPLSHSADWTAFAPFEGIFFMKKCRICQEEKPSDDFYQRALRCKACILKINHEQSMSKYGVIPLLDGELWQRIGSTNKYVSNMGRVKKIFYHGKEVLMKQWTTNKGYKMVEIDNSNRSVHILVAEAFIPNPLKKPEVNHKFGIKSDNRATELEWMTHQENIKHSFDIGLQSNKGENHPQAILTLEKSKEIKTLIALKSMTQRKIAAMYGVGEHTISKIKVGKLWNY